MKRTFHGAVLRGESNTEEGIIAVLLGPNKIPGESHVVQVLQSVPGYEALCALYDNWPEDQELLVSFEAECPNDPRLYCSSTISPTLVFAP